MYDSEGVRLYPGRWNLLASPIIYTSEHYSTAMLEKLVHANSILPPTQHYVRITIPQYQLRNLPDCRASGVGRKDEGLCKAFGQAWYKERRSAILLVPSMAARVEHNLLTNPVHPDAREISHELPEPVW